jgi:hypothetical protein
MTATVALATIASITPITMVALRLVAAVITPFITSITVLLLVTRHIFPLVPVVLHKVDALAAGIVFATVFFPILGVTWRHAQIDRRTIYLYPLDDHRLTID